MGLFVGCYVLKKELHQFKSLQKKHDTLIYIYLITELKLFYGVIVLNDQHQIVVEGTAGCLQGFVIVTLDQYVQFCLKETERCIESKVTAEMF